MILSYLRQIQVASISPDISNVFFTELQLISDFIGCSCIITVSCSYNTAAVYLRYNQTVEKKVKYRVAADQVELLAISLLIAPDFKLKIFCVHAVEKSVAPLLRLWLPLISGR